MNALNRLQSSRASLSDRLKQVRQSRFFQDKLSLGLIVAAVILNVVTVVSLLAHVRPTDVPVPTHYSSLRSFDALGPWFWPFEVAIFGFIVTIMNTAFAYSSYNRSRLASFLLQSGGVVVAVFTFIIASAFGSVAPQ